MAQGRKREERIESISPVFLGHRGRRAKSEKGRKISRRRRRRGTVEDNKKRRVLRKPFDPRRREREERKTGS